MKEKLLSAVRNYSLRSKIILIVLIVMGLVTGVSAICLKMTVDAGNSMYYKALAGSLSYTAEDIATKLSTIESMTNMIVTNSDIRKNLIVLLNEDYEIKKKNARSNLERFLVDYHQTYKNNNVAYISLYSNDVCITSYAPGVSQTPEHIHTNLITETKMNSGYPVWDTSYCNTHGLFLGREARQVNHLSFRTLGTVVVCLDIEKMIETSTNSVLLSDEIQYVLMDENGKVFYRPKDFTQKQAVEISKQVTSGYQVLNMNDTSYFAVQGSISPNTWKYICLVPYEEMSKTIYATEIMVTVLIVVTLCLVFFVSHIMTKLIVSDVTVLVNQMGAFFQDDAMSFQIDTSYQNRKDEIGILHKQFNHMVLQIQNMIQQNYISEILAKEAQLKALENQINPHFLYNTLESVNWRAKAIGESEISAMVESLGRLLRETISVKDKVVSLEHELRITAAYITIQKIRYGDRLEYSEDVPRGLLELQLPHLTIQPLVENAIYYALEEVIGVCRIEVSARKEGELFIVTVKNNGSQFEENALEKMMSGKTAAHGFGVGILNIEKRIQIIYGENYGLELGNADEDTAIVNIYLPGGTDGKTADC